MNAKLKTIPVDKFELAVTNFLARYSNQGTIDAYQLDLRLLFEWCKENSIKPLAITRSGLELFARYLENDRHNSLKTIHRRLSTIKFFYKIAEIDDYIKKSPAVYLRLPRIFRDETKILGLDRMELGALIATAKASTPSDAALICLMGLLGLRVSEACNLKIEDTHYLVRGHRVLTILGKGSKPATIPIPIPVGRVIDLAAGNRLMGWLLLRANGTQMDRRSAARVVTRLAKKAGIQKKISPHTLRHSFITAALDAGVPLRDVQIAARHSDPRMTVLYDRARNNLDRHANYIVSAFVAGAA